MNARPDISIITPAWNAGRFLAETVRSVEAQTLSDWELVIVDDGSSDDTVEVAKRCAASDSRVRLLVHTQNRGQSMARNTGFTNASAEARFYLFLDADDTLTPGALELLRRALELAPSAPAAHGRALKMDGDSRLLPDPEEPGSRREVVRVGRHWRVRQLRDGEPTSFGALCVRPYLTTPGQVLIRRESLLREGKDPWRATADFWSDSDLWLRLARQGGFEMVPHVVLHWRTHPANMSSRVGTNLAGLERIHLLKHTAQTPEEREQLLAGWRASDRLWAGTRLSWAMQSLKAGHPIEAAKHVRHAGRTLAHSRTLTSYRTGVPASL